MIDDDGGVAREPRVVPDDVAPDGSPLEVYLALSAEPDLSRVRAVISPSASILDLGCGPGRLANPLAASGHDVTAVDDSLAMLEHVVGSTTVHGDVWSLDLDRRFDVVLALSHLINDPSRSRRVALLDVCRRHTVEGGTVVVQRYAPTWRPVDGTSAVGEVGVRLHDVVEGTTGSFAAAVTYTLDGRSWTQRFAAAIVDDDELASLARDNGFIVAGAMDAAAAWIRLVAG